MSRYRIIEREDGRFQIQGMFLGFVDHTYTKIYSTEEEAKAGLKFIRDLEGNPKVKRVVYSD